MCLIKVCKCGCNRQTRKIIDILISVGVDGVSVKQVVHLCDNCGNSFLSSAEKRWNMKRIEEVKIS